MEASKYLYSFREFIWSSWIKHPDIYKKGSILLKFLSNMNSPHDSVVLYHNCPILLNSAMYDIANCTKLSRSVFTRCATCVFEYKDSTITYRSNDYYILIDCQTFSQVEKRSIPELIKSLLASQNVYRGYHVILLENIDCMSEDILHSIKCIIGKNLQNAKFICTTRKQTIIRNIFQSVCFFITCDYDISATIDKFITCNHSNLMSISDDLKQIHKRDVGLILATLHFSKPHLYISHIDSYMHEKLHMLTSCDDADVFPLIRTIVNDLMAAFISIKQIAYFIISYTSGLYPHLIYDVISLLTMTDMYVAESNKIVFAYELFFMRYRHMIVK